MEHSHVIVTPPKAGASLHRSELDGRGRWPRATAASSWRHFVCQVGRFLAVGVVATIVTVGLFNGLVHWGTAPMRSVPFVAYALSFMIGTVLAFTGNRYWAFNHRQSSRQVRDFTVFVALNAVALAIPLLTLAISRHGLNLHSFWADNVSANGFGLILATAFRFWAYRRWVFS